MELIKLKEFMVLTKLGIHGIMALELWENGINHIDRSDESDEIDEVDRFDRAV